MNVASPDRVRFGIFEFDRRNRLLYRDGRELALPPRAVGVLACLLERSGQVVSKHDLLNEVWKDANVTETSLSEAVSLLRQTLADDPQRPTFIQTLPRRGYRFVHPLSASGGATDALVDAGRPEAAHEKPLREASAAARAETLPLVLTRNAQPDMAGPTWRPPDARHAAALVNAFTGDESREVNGTQTEADDQHAHSDALWSAQAGGDQTRSGETRGGQAVNGERSVDELPVDEPPVGDSSRSGWQPREQRPSHVASSVSTDSRTDRTARTDRPVRGDHTNQADRADRTGRADRTDRPDHTDPADRLDRADRTVRPDRADRTERTDRADIPAENAAAVAVPVEVAVGDAVAGTDREEQVWPGWLPWVLLAGVSVALFVVLATTAREPSRTVRPVARFTLSLPADLALATGAPAIALSNDGRRLAFVAARAGAPARVFIRDLDQLEPAALADTEDAAAPFFSPDGQWVGFFARGQLRKTPVGGGPVQTLCLAPHPFGATWTPDGSIIFASSWTGGLQRVSDDGGEPVVLTTPDAANGEMRHAWPDLLPDGRGVLFAGLSGSDAPETARVAVLSLERRAIHPLFEAATFPRFVSTGHLLFLRGDAVFAAPFDPAAFDVLGPAAPVLDAVRTAGPHGAAQIAVTRAGNLVAATADGADAPDELRWVNAAGAASRSASSSASGFTSRSAATPSADPAPAAVPATLGWPFPARLLRALAVTANGARVAASLGDGHRADIWIGDLPNGVATRLTTTGQNVMPQWTPDGRVIFSARRDEAFNLFVKSPDDDAAAMRLTSSPANQFVSSAASARGAIFVQSDPRTGLDLWLLPWTGGAPRPLARTARDEAAGALSPDGRWLAYQIGDGAAWRVVVRAAGREEDPPLPLAEGDGTLTAWSADSRALFFVRDGRLLRLPLTDSASPSSPDPDTGTRAMAETVQAAARGAGAADNRTATARTNASAHANANAGALAGQSTATASATAPSATAADVADAADIRGAGAPLGGLRAAGPAVMVSDAGREAVGYAPSGDGRVLIAAHRAAATRPRLEIVLEWARELSLKVPIQPPALRPVR